MSRIAQAVLDRQALRQNLGRVRVCAPRSRVLAVVKADAYGHGMVAVAQCLAAGASDGPGVDGFGVACLEEAITLRGAGVAQPILLLEGFFSRAELALIQCHRLDVVVHHPAQLELLESLVLSELPLPEPLRVWLKLDTGMHRLGFPPERAAEAWQRLRACSVVAPDIRLMTHFSSADDPNDPTTERQLAAFAQATAGIAAERSLANSAAVLAWPASHADWVRPGIMLYGASPFAAGFGVDLGLRPAMTVSSVLMAVSRYRRGERIGYAGTYTCPDDMPVGVVAFGYGDGYPRHARAGTPVLVGGQRVPLIGRVSMDMICVDLRLRPEARIGEPVELWGESLPVEEIARCAETIPYELLCGVTRRVRFTVR